MTMIDLQNLSYSYRRGSLALSDITTRIEPGIHLLLGENGAGKTTLLHILDGLLIPSAGTCDVDGYAPARRQPDYLNKVFFLSESFECPFSTINRMADCHAPFYPRFDRERLAENLAAFGLDGSERIKNLSLGMRRKAFVAYALSLQVELLLLDEPANGLDIDSKKELRRMIGRSIPEDGTVIISTHTVHDLQSLFDGVIILSHGQLLLSMPTWEISRRLAFVASTSPLQQALYQEPEGGLFRAVIPNDDALDTDVNYALLYSAVMSPSSQAVLDALKTDNDEE